MTTIGFCAAFASFPVGARVSQTFAPPSIADIRIEQLPEHLRPETLPAWMDLATYETLYQFGLLMHIPALLLFGAILGTAQYLVLRRRLAGAWIWILATAIGFGAILVLEVVAPHIVIGPTAGPVEPILIVLGGGALAGAAQAWFLSFRGIPGPRYFAFWIGGLALGVALAVPVLSGVGLILEDAIGRLTAAVPEVAWGLEVVLFALIFGAVAGTVSARGLRDLLEPMSSPDKATAAAP